MSHLTHLPVVLRPGRVKQTIMLFLCLVFVACGVLLRRQGDVMAYLCTAFFGLGCVVFSLNYFPSAAYLKLEEDSFTFASMFRARTVRWADVTDFGGFRIKHNRMVGWNYSPTYAGKRTMRSLNQSLCGFDAALPDTYGMKLEVLVDEMQKLRDAYWEKHGLHAQQEVMLHFEKANR